MSSTKHHESCGIFPVWQEENGSYRDAALLVAFLSLLEGQLETTPVDDIPVMV